MESTLGRGAEAGELLEDNRESRREGGGLKETKQQAKKTPERYTSCCHFVGQEAQTNGHQKKEGKRAL
jgi:hypothetical protein